MIARLFAFYGGSLSDWMRSPIGLVRMLAGHLARLEAERLFGLHQIVQSATGHMTTEGHRSLMGRLERAMTAGRKQKSGVEQLAAMGINVVDEREKVEGG